MTDERYVYQQDIREKKTIGRSAFAKRTGSKTRYVGLPSDHLTEAQKKRRNGPVRTYNINKCIHSWAVFKSMPSDLKATYMRNCLNTYGARAPQVAEVFEINPVTLRKHLIDSGIAIGGRGGRYTLSPDWDKFVAGELNIMGKPFLPDEPDKTEDKILEVSPAPVVLDKPALIAKPEINPYRVTLSLEGTPAQLADLIAVLTDSATAYDFKLTITAAKGGETT